ncbi:hypothetical protein BDZ45DRAFT_180762 [Acephala macrosclerotiorum]|nr:hypothetical protein BDZ45DRAFT_180762 [Acephala macrosclerotiorum]
MHPRTIVRRLSRALELPCKLYAPRLWWPPWSEIQRLYLSPRLTIAHLLPRSQNFHYYHSNPLQSNPLHSTPRPHSLLELLTTHSSPHPHDLSAVRQSVPTLNRPAQPDTSTPTKQNIIPASSSLFHDACTTLITINFLLELPENKEPVRLYSDCLPKKKKRKRKRKKTRDLVSLHLIRCRPLSLFIASTVQLFLIPDICQETFFEYWKRTVASFMQASFSIVWSVELIEQTSSSVSSHLPFVEPERSFSGCGCLDSRNPLTQRLSW